MLRRLAYLGTQYSTVFYIGPASDFHVSNIDVLSYYIRNEVLTLGQISKMTALSRA